MPYMGTRLVARGGVGGPHGETGEAGEEQPFIQAFSNSQLLLPLINRGIYHFVGNGPLVQLLRVRVLRVKGKKRVRGFSWACTHT